MANELSPQITDNYSDLHALIMRATRRAGEFSGESVDGDLGILMLDFANEIVEEMRIHPYWPADVALSYYEALTDRRPIPDIIMANGLRAQYLLQQGDARAGVAMQQYYRMTNTILYQRKFGVQKLELQRVDRPDTTAPDASDPAPWPAR